MKQLVAPLAENGGILEGFVKNVLVGSVMDVQFSFAFIAQLASTKRVIQPCYSEIVPLLSFKVVLVGKFA